MIKKTTIKWIREHITIIVIVICLCVILIPYVYVFGKNGLSDCVSDWAAFGNYTSGTVVIISVWLLYKTYREQSVANKRVFFEKSLYQKIETVKDQLQEYDSDISSLCEDLLKPFIAIDFATPQKDYPTECYEKALQHCYEYYTMNRGQNPNTIPEQYRRNTDHVEEIEDLIQYCGDVLAYIRDFPLIDNKSVYVSDFKTLFSDELKVVVFFYVVYKSDSTLIQVFKDSGVFKWRNMENRLFLWVVRLICKEKDIVNIPCPDNFDINTMRIDDGKDKLVESNNFLAIVDYYSQNK